VLSYFTSIITKFNVNYSANRSYFCNLVSVQEKEESNKEVRRLNEEVRRSNKEVRQSNKEVKHN
jgi:hypothetical protein